MKTINVKIERARRPCFDCKKERFCRDCKMYDNGACMCPDWNNWVTSQDWEFVKKDLERKVDE